LAFFFFFLSVLLFELRANTLSHSTSPFFVMGFFCGGIFWDRVLQTICLGWLWTVILQISASWVGLQEQPTRAWPLACILFLNCAFNILFVFSCSSWSFTPWDFPCSWLLGWLVRVLITSKLNSLIGDFWAVEDCGTISLYFLACRQSNVYSTIHRKSWMAVSGIIIHI
jgi:hypothetical protein